MARDSPPNAPDTEQWLRYAVSSEVARHPNWTFNAERTVSTRHDPPDVTIPIPATFIERFYPYPKNRLKILFFQQNRRPNAHADTATAMIVYCHQVRSCTLKRSRDQG